MDSNTGSVTSANNGPKTSKTKEYKIDHGKLEAELHRELDSEKRYWIQNEAKIRAVNTVATYEDFRQIVLAAHLRPLDKKDKDKIGPGAGINNKVVWNSLALNGGNGDCDQAVSVQVSGVVRKTLEVPAGIHEFIRVWKELENDAEKCTYLQRLVNDDDCPLKRIFSFEVPIDILPNIFQVLEIQLHDLVTAKLCLRVLEIIAGSQRFAITQIFISTAERQTLKTIISKIEKLLKENQVSTNGDRLESILEDLGNVKFVSEDCENVLKPVPADSGNVLKLVSADSVNVLKLVPADSENVLKSVPDDCDPTEVLKDIIRLFNTVKTQYSNLTE